MLTPADLIQRLVACRAALPNEIEGCTADDIHRLEWRMGMKLPKSYREFLSAIGKRAGKFMLDVEYLYDKLPRLTEEAKDILNDWEKGTLSLPSSAFVFSMRYGEQFMYFVADGKNDDPPIYHYYEGHAKFTRIADSLWNVIETELRSVEDLYQTNPNNFFFDR